MQRFLVLKGLLVLMTVSIFVSTGCVPSAHRIAEELGRPPECRIFIERVDEEVRRAGTSDAAYYPLPGFPYLRTSRFLAALNRDLLNDSQRRALVEWMRELDSLSRRKEILNLPAPSGHSCRRGDRTAKG